MIPFDHSRFAAGGDDGDGLKGEIQGLVLAMVAVLLGSRPKAGIRVEAGSRKLSEVDDYILTSIWHHQITRRGWKMVTIGILAILLGATLAQYFKVFVLFPSCAAVLASAVALESVWGESLAHSMIAGALAAVGLQLGYFLGLTVRQLIAAWSHPGLTKSQQPAFPSES